MVDVMYALEPGIRHRRSWIDSQIVLNFKRKFMVFMYSVKFHFPGTS